jgi:DNA-binding NtrC family response regulator
MALAEGHPQPIDLLLTDVLLPEENGLSLSRRVAAVRPGLRVAFMSGYTGDVLGSEFSTTVPFLSKPFTPGALLLTVRQALDG